MAADEPPYLNIGTDVSAKYKGAFCEAKIKKVNKVVKCKVTFKNGLGTFMVTDDQVKGNLRIGEYIDAKHPEKNQFCEGVINKLQDYSQYTVVFDDGDETTLRRTSLCLKSGRHFAESPTLDQFPLTNPEHFGTPVLGSSKFKRKRRSTMNSSVDYESSDDEGIPRKMKAIRGKYLGKVVCVDSGDRRKKENWYPGLIVAPSSKMTKEEYLIRSFKDGKYYRVPKKDTREFSKEAIQKVENNSLRTAIEKAINYLEKDELPMNWVKLLYQSVDEDSPEIELNTSDDEPSEEKDRFVAQLYKFMEERGTPINTEPSLDGTHIDLYKLFKVMQQLGGYNKVTNKKKWKFVFFTCGYVPSALCSPNRLKFAYKRYLQSFEDFYRKLGCTMVSNNRSTRVRHRSDRRLVTTRTREKGTASPKSRSARNPKEKVSIEKKSEERPKVTEQKEGKTEELSKVEDKVKSPEKKKVEKSRSEEKDEKRKKVSEEKPRLIRSQSFTKEKKDVKPEKARTREDARKEKNDSPEKKGTRSSSKIELLKKEKEVALKEKEKSPKEKDKKEEKPPVTDSKEEKPKVLKKEDKSIRDRKPPKEKKPEEKVVKEKREIPSREKKEDKPVKEKRDSSKEPKDDKGTPKAKKEEAKNGEEKSPKRKLERLNKEKKEERVPSRSRSEEKPLSSDVGKKPPEELEAKEEKPPKSETIVKKEDLGTKEKLRPKLRERKEDSTLSGDEGVLDPSADTDERDVSSQDSFERKSPSSRMRGDDGDESPNKAKRRSLKLDEKDEKESLLGLSDSDESFSSEKNYGKEVKHNEIEIGDRVKVKYGRGRLQKVYEAKVLKIEMDGTEKRFYVHYAGWNTRYDEWVRKNYIVANISSTKQTPESKLKTSSSLGIKKVDRGRPPGVLANTKPDRKSSTSSSSSRATRSEKKSLLTTPPSGGPEPKKRTRRKSGTTTSTIDVSQESDTDGADVMDLEDEDVDYFSSAQLSSSFKEELFSDDEEKEKLEDVKRGDITELEKAISVEEGVDDIKGHYFDSAIEENSVSEKMTVLENQKVEQENVDKEVIKGYDQVSEGFESGKESLSVKQEDEKPCIPTESQIISQKDNVNSLTPSKIIFPSVSLPDAKMVKIPDFALTSSNPPSVPSCSIALGHLPSHKPFVLESKAALSFEGLIKKSADIIVSAPQKLIIASQVLSAERITVSSNEAGKSDLESKPIMTDTFKPMSIFGSVLNSPSKPQPQKTEPVCMSEEKTLPQDNNSVSEMENDSLKKTSIVEIKSRPNPQDLPQELKVPVQTSLSPNSTSFESIESVKENIINPAKLSDIKSTDKLSTSEGEDLESRPKDTFDMLLEGCTNFRRDPPKMPEVKDNIFSFSFGSCNIPKESSTLDATFGNLPRPPSSESLCRIKPNVSETVDVSKMIPGILERLKKDVVSDLKVSDSPPPPKEELRFDFLRGSQNTSKSLSRSDSSNSLRICESDTNDSNTESKDLVTCDKLEMPTIVPDSSGSHGEKSIDKSISKCIPESNLSENSSLSNADSNEIQKKESEVVSQQASVIIATVVPPIDEQSLPVTENQTLPSKDEPVATSLPEKVELSAKDAAAKVSEPDDPPEFELENSTAAEVVSTSENVTSFSAAVEQDFTDSDHVENPLNVPNKSEPKESLFDEIKSIFDNSYEKSTVIKCVSNVAEIVDPNEDSKSVVLDKEDPSSVKVAELVESTVVCDQDLLELNSNSGNGKDNKAGSTAILEKETSLNTNFLSEEGAAFSQLSKKDVKRKKLGKKIGKRFGSAETSEKEDKDLKMKEGKIKSKKRPRLENCDGDKVKSLDLKSKSKKLKKSKNKKRFSRHDDLFGEHIKKFEFRDNDHRVLLSDKIKRKDKRRNEKKFLKCGGLKNEDFADGKSEILKKKKSKKNRDRLTGDKKDFFEKKTKKKRKSHPEDNQDTDSEKESLPKIVDKKRKKERKKFKVKDCSSSDEGGDFFKEKELASTSFLRQDSSKSDDPDMSFLLCEEKVPASPGGVADDTSGSSSNEDSGGRLNPAMDLLPVYPCSSRESTSLLHKNNIDNVLDNTPPTTPSSTESPLSSSPSHERDSFPINYPESTQSGEDLFHCESNRVVARGSEEYRAATTLAFAVCKSVSEKPKDSLQQQHSFAKREKSEHSPSKRKKKRVQRYSESTKSPKHKSSYPRLPKVESYCEDSSGTSPATSSSPPYSNISTLSFSKSLPHRLSGISDGPSRHFYVPLHEKDPEKRISVLQDKMAALRKRYMALRAEVVAIDHKRRRARKKVRESGGVAANPSIQSEDGQSCS